MQVVVSDYYVYFDYVGYSWDSYYTIGDNIDNLALLDFTCYVEFEEFHDYFLHFNCSAWYYTSILTQVNFSIYDFTNEEWILINSSSNDVNYLKSEFTEVTSSMYDLIDTGNDNQVLLRFQALNISEFNLYLDCLNVTIHRKLLLSHTKTFTLLGTWKYRFHIPEDEYASNWYYFDVIEHQENFMAISESDFITKWVLINNDTTISTSRIFVDDFTGSYSWTYVDENGDPITKDYIEYSFVATKDAYAHELYPDDNFGSYTYIQTAGYNWYPRYLRYRRFRYFRPLFKFLHAITLRILKKINNTLLNRLSAILIKY